ncbi:MAG: hypothetical protein IKJ65_01305 [Clostridia bacterium]|nr:hypothetical protein [Clostridia bacterium]
MKKSVLFSLLLALALSLFAFCAFSETAWERNVHEHWILNENEERTEVGAHQMNDAVCEICQSNIWMFDDGTCDVSNYNEYEDLTRYSYYDQDGAILDDYVYVYTYNDSGVKTHSMTYYFGVLIEETEYSVDPFGYSIKKRALGYNDDGSTSVTECDEYGNVLVSRITAADGRVVLDAKYEYTYGEDGFPTYAIQDTVFEDGSLYHLETDGMGNIAYETQTDSDGTVVYAHAYTYEYDEQGRVIVDRIWEDGQIIFESFYAYEGDNFWGYQCMTIDYFENGSKTVCEINENGEIVKETNYNSDGEVIS